VCIEIGHAKPDCKVLDLYNVPDPQKYLNPLEARIESGDISEPLAEYYRNGKMGDKMFNLMNDEDEEEELDDESESDEGNGGKSI
jgi:hypothetical protein